MSARDDRRHGFFILDNEIVEVHGSTIGVFGVAVYAALAQQAGSAHRCHPSITYIAQTLNCSPRKVRDTLRHLEAVGLIATERRGGEKGERQTSSAYALLPVTKLEKYATQTPRPPARGAAPPARGAAPPRHVVPPLNKNYSEQEQEEPFTNVQGSAAAGAAASAPLADTAADGLTVEATAPVQAKAKRRPPSRPAPRRPWIDAHLAAFHLSADDDGAVKRAAKFEREVKGHTSATPEAFAAYVQAMIDAGEWGRYITGGNVAERFKAWLDVTNATAADVPLAQVIAERCGWTWGLLSANERRAFGAIAGDGRRARLDAAHLDAALVEARREPRFTAAAVPAWRLRQALAAVTAQAVDR